MKLRQLTIIGVPVLIIALGYMSMKFFASKAVEPEKKMPVKVERFVRVGPVVYNESMSSITAYGRVVSAQSINMISEVAGRVIAGDVPLKAAQTFKKGQVIYRIDDAELRLTIQAQKSDFINAIASILPDMNLDYPEHSKSWNLYLYKIDIRKPLVEMPEITNPQVQTFLSSRGVLNRYYTIKSAEERIAKHVFRAPYNGSIAEIKIEAGSILNVGGQIGRIIRTDEMEVEIPVRVEMIKFVKKGADVLLFSQDRADSWKGKVARVADFVDPSTQSINTYVTIRPSQGSPIYEGFYLQAEIAGKSLGKAMEAPRQALINQNQVYVVEHGNLKAKAVNIIKTNAETFFFNGLDENELLVIESIV
ncbi:MAG: HlyD family efflux transporter periplasmic adaptor subunit, partial [Bacteroidetes bacterium]|nr:HlyD family efflux transporter periplasmic adaptor subunit [Bacteroidota bacterium]